MKKRTRILTTMCLSVCLTAGMLVAGCGSANNAATGSGAGSEANAETTQDSSASDSNASDANAESLVSTSSESATESANDATEAPVANSSDEDADDASSSTEATQEGNARYAYYANIGRGIGTMSIEDADPDEADGAVYAQNALDSFRTYKITANKPIKNFALYDVTSDEDANITVGAMRFACPVLQTDEYIFMSDMIAEVFPNLMIQWEEEDGVVYQRYISESGFDGALFLTGYMDTLPEKENTEDSYYIDQITLIAEEVIDEAGLIEALDACIGWGGDSGSSLKGASATGKVCTWVAQNDAMNTCAEVIFVKWYEALDEDQRENFMSNWENSIKSNAEALIAKDEFVMGLLEDSGVDEASISIINDSIDKELFADYWEFMDKMIQSVSEEMEDLATGEGN